MYYCIFELERIFRELECEHESININEENFNNLRFPDDVVLIVNNIPDINLMFDELNKNSMEVGLHVNTEKSCIIANVGKEEKICLCMQEINIYQKLYIQVN